MKSKPVIIAGLVVLVILLAISIITVNKPQQAGTKAQALDATQQCINDGGFVTGQSSCTGADRQIISVIGGGDLSNVQVCCKTITVNTPTPARYCPPGSSETAEASCPVPQIVTPISSTADGGDGIYVRPGIVCCRNDIPTPTTSTPGNPSPTPTTCPLPSAPSISISSVEVVCPGVCTP